MLRVLVEAEQRAVRGYTANCYMPCGKDHRTYHLSLAILHQEIEDEAWSFVFLGEGPSGHSICKSGQNSHYVRRFLGAR